MFPVGRVRGCHEKARFCWGKLAVRQPVQGRAGVHDGQHGSFSSHRIVARFSHRLRFIG